MFIEEEELDENGGKESVLDDTRSSLGENSDEHDSEASWSFGEDIDKEL
jgi:hypothetical protein